MFLDALMNLASDSMGGMMSALPSWVPSVDTTEVVAVLTMISAWNNWLPLDQLCICIGIAVGLWIAMQALAIAFKAIETVKP